jgi:Fe-S-cluster containining protein
MSEGDLTRWKKEKREDILSIMENWHPVWMGDHLINSANGRLIHNCPFLIIDSGNLCSCQIYETRPEACRDYDPGSSRICPLFKNEKPVLSKPA